MGAFAAYWQRGAFDMTHSDLQNRLVRSMVNGQGAANGGNFNITDDPTLAVAVSAFTANVFIPDVKLAPLVPMIVSVAVLAIILLYDKNDDENREWALSSWGFAKLILPLLEVGVLTAGFLLGSTHDGIELPGIVPNSWVERAVGGNSLLSNFFASFTGAFMYFATLTEVPIIQGLLASGMGKGPALALLLAGPSLSLPNMLVIRGVMGTKKTLIYVALVIVMATISGWVYGYFF